MYMYMYGQSTVNCTCISQLTVFNIKLNNNRGTSGFPPSSSSCVHFCLPKIHCLSEVVASSFLGGRSRAWLRTSFGSSSRAEICQCTCTWIEFLRKNEFVRGAPFAVQCPSSESEVTCWSSPLSSPLSHKHAALSKSLSLSPCSMPLFLRSSFARLACSFSIRFCSTVALNCRMLCRLSAPPSNTRPLNSSLTLPGDPTPDD